MTVASRLPSIGGNAVPSPSKGMAHLLVPPIRSEATRGFLWRKKTSVEFHSRIATPEQAIGCGIAMFRALAGEYSNRRRIGSISALIVGEVETTFHAYGSFLSEAESTKKASAWLLEKVPFFSVGFKTPDGQLIRSFDYETIDGRRSMTSMRPMDDEEQDAALKRVTKGLQDILDNQ